MNPPGPTAIWYGPASALGTGYSVICPDGLIRPILLASNSVSHIVPPGPAAMSKGSAPAVGTRNSCIEAAGDGQVLTMERDRLAAPQSGQHLKRLIQPGGTVPQITRFPERDELLGHRAEPGAEDQPATILPTELKVRTSTAPPRQ